jgi:hypothetical protein
LAIPTTDRGSVSGQLPTVNEHLGNIYEEAELQSVATIRKFRIVQIEGGRQVAREVEHYNLAAIMAIGYRVRSPQGTQFRQWATAQLQELLVRGFVLDDERIKAGRTLGQEYFDELLERIRDIRSSERIFYQKITDIYSTSIDYDANIAKNYLSKDEIAALNLIVSAYLDFAEIQARRHHPMHMSDWIAKLDDFLRISDIDVLTHAGKISHESATEYAISEYQKHEQHRRELEVAVPDSDFDRACQTAGSTGSRCAVERPAARN